MGIPEEEQRDVALKDLRVKIARWTEGQERYDSPIPGLYLFQIPERTAPKSVVSEPSICLIAQGAKRLILGEETLEYSPERYLLTSVHVPTIVQVSKAEPDRPYLGLRLCFDKQQLSQLVADGELPPPRNSQPERGMAVGRLTLPMLSAFQRLLGLLDEPQDIPILAPTLQKEIIYRLLVGEQGPRLREIASEGSQTNHIAHTIEWLQDNYSEPLKVDDLASMAQMSSSTFYQHFRSMTALSPLQYQKRLRLQEARRLMLSEDLDAASAGFQVGYESASQFSREYRRHFGAPPVRDIQQLKVAVQA